MRAFRVRTLLLTSLILAGACQTPEPPRHEAAPEAPQPAEPAEPAEAEAPAPTGYPDPADHADGWAGSATTGGAGGVLSMVHTRAELVSALNAGGAGLSDAPKIIVVVGTIDLCSEAAPLTPETFLSRAGLSGVYPSYTQWKAAYAASCQTGVASTLAASQKTLANLQKAAITLKVGSNTTLLGKGGALVHGSVVIDGKTNVVVRNLTISDAFDFFPAWDPSENLINAEYDNLSITNSTRVWVDHCRFDDAGHADAEQGSVIVSSVEKKWVVHDGLVDVVRGSDFVTLSWNQIRDHDKTMLIGNSDTSTIDAGKLRVTVHHNAFQNAKQRLPRVRFGQVHVYNNWYSNASGYAIGVGDQARIVSESNVFEGVPQSFAAYDDATNVGYYIDTGSLGVGSPAKSPATPELVGWSPANSYAYALLAADQVKAAVQTGAGPAP